VIRLGAQPNGLNINQHGGSLFPEITAEKVRETRADIGLALDGDADRLIVVDERGTVLDGDQIMALVADDLLERGQLRNNTLVSTVMSNMSLEVFLRERGCSLVRTPVGDRYVVEAMRRHGAIFGGEQSGHLVFMDHGTTGDGLLAALQILRIMRERGKPLSELAGQLQLFPQELINVVVEKKVPLENCKPVQQVLQQAEREIGPDGRILLRYSGTEPLCRIMVEGKNAEQVHAIAARLAAAVREFVSRA
jgi:phosphoglucosamine mutase